MPTNRLDLTWTDATWTLIQLAIHDEAARSRIARKFLPLQTPADATTISADSIRVNGHGVVPGIELRTQTTDIVELAVNVYLTTQESAEADAHSAVSLVTYAANLIANAEDQLIFRGQEAVDHSPIFQTVRVDRGAPGPGLLNAPGVGSVRVRRDGHGAFTETIYPRVAEACAELQAHHAGRLALVLPTRIYPDTFAVIPETPKTPKDLIGALVEDRFYASSALPADRGLMVALDGNTMDLVVTVDANATFLQVDARGRFDMSVSERLALRLKDPSAVVRLEFAAAAVEAGAAGTSVPEAVGEEAESRRRNGRRAVTTR